MATGIGRDLPPVHFRREDRKLKQRVQTVEPEQIIQMGVYSGMMVCLAGGWIIHKAYEVRSPLLAIGGTGLFTLGLIFPK